MISGKYLKKDKIFMGNNFKYALDKKRYFIN